MKSIQESYAADLSVCYGCGTRNPRALGVRSYCDGEETVCRFTPEAHHTAVAGVVSGGVIASVIDCHGTATAAAAAARAAGVPVGSIRFVTASLQVDYLRPTPIDAPLELRGRVKEAGVRKVIVEIDLVSQGELCARGVVVAVARRG